MNNTAAHLSRRKHFHIDRLFFLGYIPIKPIFSKEGASVNPKDTLNILDGNFKDSAPLDTIQTIQGILQANGIETEESWRQTGVPYCYALSVRIVGTSFSTNGKGLTPEFARASAYGELMERLQIGAIARTSMQKDGFNHSDGDSSMTCTVNQLLIHQKWYDCMAQRFKRTSGLSVTARQILSGFADDKGQISVVPFYNLTADTPVFFPIKLRNVLYTSNGCAAGNSPEEALVQGISEIVERHHMSLINDLGCALPDIPEDVIQSYPVVRKIINHLRQMGYRVTVKDCTLGLKFPVVCVCIVDTRTGRYHTHFGAYPILEIALERALTESFQGYHANNIARYEDFLHKKPGELSIESITNEMAHGTHIKLLSYFVGTPEHSFNANMGFSGTDNRSLLKECIAYFKSMDFEILARDLSCLDFCTYQIVIPGYSEVFLHRLSPQLNEFRYANSAIRAILDPVKASLPDKLSLLMHLDNLQKNPSTSSDSSSFLAVSRISADLSFQQDQFQMSAALASIYFDMGKFQLVTKQIQKMLPICTAEEAEPLICLKRYLDMKSAGYTPEYMEGLLRQFHKAETVQRVLQGKNLLHDFVVRCEWANCSQCRIQQSCQQKRVTELTELIRQKARAMDTTHSHKKLQALL